MTDKKTFVITAGGTHEHIDDVRYITNHATGALPASMAECLLGMGHDVVYIHGPKARTPKEVNYGGSLTFVPVTSAHDMSCALTLICLSTKPYAVICAAAVADFSPVKMDGKISSQQASEDGSITIKMYPTAKVIDAVKACAPKARLLGFKFLAGATVDELEAAGLKLIRRSGAEMVFCNTLEQYQDRKGFLLREGTGEFSTSSLALDGGGSVYTLARQILTTWL